MYKRHAIQAIRLAIVLLSILALCLFFYHAFSFIYPILTAFLLSFFLHPIVSILEQKIKMPRPIATFFTMVGIFTVMTAFLIAAVTEMYQSTIFLAEKIPIHFQSFLNNLETFFYHRIMPMYEKALSLLSTLDQEQQEAVKENLNVIMADVSTSITELLQNMLLSLPVFFSILPNSVAVTVFIVLATFIITNDWNKLKENVDKLLSKQLHERFSTILHYLKKALGGYFKAQIILISITFFLILIGLTIIGVDHALTIAFLSSITDLIPYLGIGIVFIPWIIYVFLQANYSLTIALCLLYMLLTVIRQVLEPKILSANIGVNPLAALIGMFIGIQVWGVFGLILAPVTLIIISAFHQAGVTRWLWNYVSR